MSNSSLVNYTRISPNKNVGRNHAIDRITPHCVAGQCSVETIGEIFAPTSRQASSNYGIGPDGRVGMYVEEKDRSWCSSSGDNDHRAVTIECASDNKAPFAFKDVVYEKLIVLCADICKRNGKSKLLWIDHKQKALSYVCEPDEMLLTVHCWFANKDCPGSWLYSRLGDLAQKVTALLNPSKTETSTGTLYKVQVGAYHDKSNAYALLKKLKAAGFDGFIVQDGGSASPAPAERKIEEGSRVSVKRGAKTYTGGKISSFVYNNVYTVDELDGDRAVLDKAGICSPFNVKDLILQ